jgi:nicotinate-nucleotide adenylyltransferase
MGADSWEEITTWREWGKVLTLTNIIVVNRPGYEITFSHITDDIRMRIVDLRKNFNVKTWRRKDTKKAELQASKGQKIYITDAINLDISSTEIRRKIREKASDWRQFVPIEVAKYVEKYELYI